MDIFSQYSISIIKNGIILDQEDITTLEDTNMNVEYNYTEKLYCKGLTLLHKLVLLTNKYPKLNKVIKEHIALYPEEVSKVDKYNWTALHMAVYTSNTRSSIETVKLLLSCSKHNINAKNDNGQTALMLASKYSNSTSSIEIIKLLLSCSAEHNIDINAQDNDGETALMLASLYSYLFSSVEKVKLLLSCSKHNIDINVKNNDGETALMCATRYSNGRSSIETVKLLLEYDAIPNKKLSRYVNNIKLLNVLS